MSTIILTTEHAASSYGLPVLAVDGEPYGPADILPSGEPAVAWVTRWSTEPARTADELDMARAFLRQAGLELTRPAPTYAVYTDEGIWAVGRSPEDAIETFCREAVVDREEYEQEFGPLQTAPMSPALAACVAEYGFDCKRDSYTILADGRLDIAP